MNITKKEISIRELTDCYTNSKIGGVRGYGNRLDIRPAFQREFIYEESEQKAVIDSVKKGFPIGVMYWSVSRDPDTEIESYEVIDGQQRITSIGDYVVGKFSVDEHLFDSLSNDEQNKILDYKILIYFCEGTTEERLDWFQTINIAGKALEQQELRNAAYTGPWLKDAKESFKSGGQADKFSREFTNIKNWDRWFGLEQAICWIVGVKPTKKSKTTEDKAIRAYMDTHCRDKDAKELFEYWQAIFSWVRATFQRGENGESIPSKLLKRNDWGVLYAKYHKNTYNSKQIVKTVNKLLTEVGDEISNVGSIIPYVLNPTDKVNIKNLQLRLFDEDTKLSQYMRQDGKCRICGHDFDYADMYGDHIIPWSKGGRTEASNCQMLCFTCNQQKTDKQVLSKQELAELGITLSADTQ